VGKNKQLINAEITLLTIGSNIRVQRQSKGWTQEQFAEFAKINDKEVSHIEMGKRNITIETLVKISNALDAQPEDLFKN